MFFSVDVETSTTNPFTGQLLSVGIVPVTEDGEIWGNGDDHFYFPLEHNLPAEWMDDSIPTEDDTLLFWRQQDPATRHATFGFPWNNSLYYKTFVLDATTMARRIENYLHEVEPDWNKRFIAANPVAFDKSWLDKLFAEVGKPTPYHYRSLCLRSMKFGMVTDPTFGSDRDTHTPIEPHHAYYDALAQAQDLCDMIKFKGMK